VNRLCGSGFQAVICAAQEILLGEAHTALVGGTENMSQSPFAVRNMRFGTRLGSKYDFEDTLWEGAIDQHIKTGVGQTAETLGAKFGITREQCDQFALRSQNRWSAANKAGYFKNELAPVTIKGKGGKDKVFEVDEHPREKTTLEGLAALPSVFKKNGSVTAGSSSGVCDGAGALVLADEESVKELNLTPLARLVSWQAYGVDPHIMGYGPVMAIRGALKRANLTLEQMDLVEVNEAFGAQFLAVEKELGLDPEKTNVNGGAIAMGHPLGMSGARITAHLAYELKRRDKKYGIGAACIAGGQGMALLIESVH